MIRTIIRPDETYSNETIRRIIITDSNGYAIIQYKNDRKEQIVPVEDVEPILSSWKYRLKNNHRRFQSEGGLTENISVFFYSWWYGSALRFIGIGVPMATAGLILIASIYTLLSAFIPTLALNGFLAIMGVLIFTLVMIYVAREA